MAGRRLSKAGVIRVNSCPFVVSTAWLRFRGVHAEQCSALRWQNCSTDIGHLQFVAGPASRRRQTAVGGSLGAPASLPAPNNYPCFTMKNSLPPTPGPAILTPSQEPTKTMNPSCSTIWAFDDIGNRKSTKTGGDSGGAGLRSASYTANNLNQYSSRDISGTVDVLGIANAAAAVTVNGQSTSRKGEYFQFAPAYTNTSAALYPFVTNTAILSGSTNTVTGQVFIAKTPETFTYDADGNQTSDGRWTNRWDGENRLITMESLASAPSASSNRLTFTYDFMGRRVSKQVETWTNSAYSTIVSNKFVYDGWNLVAELNGTNNTAIRTYLWGMDLSGSMQGAGGVGGLLAVKDTVNATHFAAYDGNGNVTGLFSAADGTSSAVYEYDPFGNLLRATGPMAKVNPFRFSTKYQDDETDWSYYGYRFYNASMGRWLSRDPIEEAGGVNLHCMIRNDALNNIDLIGLAPKPPYVPISTLNPTIGTFSVTTVQGQQSGFMGFKVVYSMTLAELTTCPCKSKEIVLVQAIGKSGIFGGNAASHFDDGAVGPNSTPDRDAFYPSRPPPYLAGLNSTGYGKLDFWDAPGGSTGKVPANFDWLLEVCAICRLKNGDTILGCVTFDFNQNARTLNVKAPVKATPPGKRWTEAVKKWDQTP